MIPTNPTASYFWVQLYTGEQEPPGDGAEAVQAKLFPASVLEVLKRAKNPQGVMMWAISAHLDTITAFPRRDG